MAAFEAAKKKLGADDEPDSLPDVPITLSPSWRAGAKLVGLMGARTLTSLRPNERAVWAENPTPMQRPFPLGAANVLAALRREYALLLPDQPIARVRLVVNADESQSPTINVEVLGVKGEVVDATEISPDTDEEAVEAPPGEATPTVLPSDMTKVTLPAETTEYVALLSSRKRPLRDETFEKWRPRLLDPVAHEPTSWFPGAALIATAEASDRNLIGVMLDYDAVRFIRMADNAPAAVFLAAFKEEGWKEVDGWIVSDRTGWPSSTYPRAEARAVIARAVAQGGLDVDAAGAWLASYPDSHPSITWLGRNLSVLLTSVGQTFGEDSVGLWGTFGIGVRDALRRGATIPLRNLSPASQRELFEQVYWGDALEDEGREVTEALPVGLGNGTVSLTVDEETVAVPWSSAKGEPLYRNAHGTDDGPPTRTGAAPQRRSRLRPVPDRQDTPLHAHLPLRTRARGLHPHDARELLRPEDRPCRPTSGTVPSGDRGSKAADPQQPRRSSHSSRGEALEKDRTPGPMRSPEVRPRSTLRVGGSPPATGRRTGPERGRAPRRCRCS